MLVAAPVSAPARDRPRSEHGATQVAPVGKSAEGAGAIAAGAADRQAAHRGRTDADMIEGSAAKPDASAHTAKQVHQRAHGIGGGSVGTGMAASTAIVALARRDPGDADARTFRAPDRAITIGNERRGAEENQSCGDNAHSASPYPKAAPTIIAAINTQWSSRIT